MALSVLILAYPWADGRAQTNLPPRPAATNTVAMLGDFSVVEFRRYTVKEGERRHFAQYFESYFPEAFQQLGAIAAGSFFERAHPNGFTWIRAFHDLDARAVVNGAFYYGPVWKEHKKTLNDLITDSDNVLLLRALTSQRAVTVLPAVDPVTEASGAQGTVVAVVFPVRGASVDSFASLAEPAFASYSGRGSP